MGLKFIVDGKAFYVNGWNSYWLMYRAMEEFSRPRVRTMLQAGAKMGLTVCRTWAFNDGTHHALQISPGRFDNHVFKKDKMGAKYGRSVDFIPPSHQQSCERSRYDLTGQSLYLPPLVGKSTYGMETVIPLKVGLPTLRSELFDRDENNMNLARELDLAEERREAAAIRLASYQQQLARGYNQKVRERKFSAGELVLKKVLTADKNPSEGKLGPNWQGPFKVVSVAGQSAYRLEDMNGKELPRPWNAAHLKKYYF
ncbi:gag-pol precursor [Cinnamomum micranthum f. kanehirae]|uniref:Gag-pol n=1 Tax=Cinnamomum micranthum f. kanehirae TaxID=337451 RepID=A0A3S3MPG4_9MAGN|nr:gag-pol precursor [Cinnamomum micranthum f. kanehirae]